MTRYVAAVLWVVLSVVSCGRTPAADGQPAATLPFDSTDYVRAPFEGLDLLATNDWWNRDAGHITNLKVARDSVVAFGAYTLANGTLKLTAQLYPLYPGEATTIYLDIREADRWKEFASSEVNPIGWHAFFRAEGWTVPRDVPYRLRHPGGATFEGTIRRPPGPDAEVVVAAMSCNSSHDTGDRRHYVANINALNPDLVFFAGDQSYFHKEHTAAWILFGEQFREVFRHRPMVSIPDDHDIGQGNLWGEGGKAARRPQGDDGGYFHDPDYVKMVERAQTSHLPDPYDPTPVAQGIGVYYTSYPLGSVDFAILEDRKFKTGPRGEVPELGPRSDHVTDPSYDPATVNLPGLVLLGDRQLEFLDQWAANPAPGTSLRAVLSQTGFCNAAHVHGSPDNRLHADLDSNGWPQAGRDAALRRIREAGAVHIAGDQHLATVIRHGIETFNDGPWAFVVPAVVNDYYSRWWWPADERPGANPPADAPLPWLGEYRDGFGNPISVYAYANPDQRDNGAGFGLIRFRPDTKTVTFECWPRTADVTATDANQFIGWPFTLNLTQ